jgi:hypothetical protein
VQSGPFSVSDTQTPIYRLRIELDYINPPIWRRVLVPANVTLDVLHLVIQAAMGWENYHLHQFMVGEIIVGNIDSESAAWIGDAVGAVEERRMTLAEAVDLVGDRLGYEYDFGDGWRHTLTIETVTSSDAGRIYPVCVAGERACPREDIGGPIGYKMFVKALSDPDDADPRGYREVFGTAFDPEAFDLDEVNARLRELSLQS